MIYICIYIYKVKGKGKVVPLRALSGPEGSRKLRFPDFMLTAQDGGKFVSLTHRPPLPHIYIYIVFRTVVSRFFLTYFFLFFHTHSIPCNLPVVTYRQNRNQFYKTLFETPLVAYRCADKSLARPRRKKARKHVRDARDFNNIETRTVIELFFFLQGKALKEIYAILTETLACFCPGRAKDFSVPL